MLAVQRDRAGSRPPGAPRCRATRRRGPRSSTRVPRPRGGARRATCSTLGLRSSGLVRGRLQLDRLAAPPAAVRGDDELRLGVVDADESASAEKPPKTTVWGAPMRAQASIAIGQLGDHRHVDRDAVAGPDAELDERVRGLLDLPMEVGEGDRAGVAGLADPVVRDLVPEPGRDVAVDAVLARRSACRPRTSGRTAAPSQGLRERLVPEQGLTRRIGPEALVVLLRARVELRARVGAAPRRRGRAERSDPPP